MLRGGLLAETRQAGNCLGGGYVKVPPPRSGKTLKQLLQRLAVGGKQVVFPDDLR